MGPFAMGNMGVRGTSGDEDPFATGGAAGIGVARARSATRADPANSDYNPNPYAPGGAAGIGVARARSATSADSADPDYNPNPYATGGAAGIGVARARSARADLANADYNPNPYALQNARAPYARFMDLRDNDAAGVEPFPRGNSAASVQPQPYSQNLGRSKSNSTTLSSHAHTPISNYSQPQSTYPPNPYKEHPTHKEEPSGGSGGDDDGAYGGYVTVAGDPDEEQPKRVLKVCYSFFFVSSSTRWLMSLFI